MKNSKGLATLLISGGMLLGLLYTVRYGMFFHQSAFRGVQPYGNYSQQYRAGMMYGYGYRNGNDSMMGGFRGRGMMNGYGQGSSYGNMMGGFTGMGMMNGYGYGNGYTGMMGGY